MHALRWRRALRNEEQFRGGFFPQERRATGRRRKNGGGRGGRVGRGGRGGGRGGQRRRGDGRRRRFRSIAISVLLGRTSSRRHCVFAFALWLLFLSAPIRASAHLLVVQQCDAQYCCINYELKIMYLRLLTSALSLRRCGPLGPRNDRLSACRVAERANRAPPTTDRQPAAKPSVQWLRLGEIRAGGLWLLNEGGQRGRRLPSRTRSFLVFGQHSLLRAAAQWRLAAAAATAAAAGAAAAAARRPESAGSPCPRHRMRPQAPGHRGLASVRVAARQ